MSCAEPSATAFPVEISTGNVTPLLHEIRHALAAWLDSGEATCIDLRGLPMAPGEEQRIIDTLGQGEVSIRIAAMGTSEVRETRFSGVWLITHHNEADEIIGRFIEITNMPAIVLAQRQDMEDGLEQLQDELAREE